MTKYFVGLDTASFDSKQHRTINLFILHMLSEEDACGQ